MRIDFVFPELSHPSSPDLTIAELANILESKYQVIEDFNKHMEKKLKDFIKKDFQRRQKLNLQRIAEWLKMQWREYIISGKAGFTIAAQKRGDPAFVETSSYYLGCQPTLVLSDKEKKKYT